MVLKIFGILDQWYLGTMVLIGTMIPCTKDFLNQCYLRTMALRISGTFNRWYI